MKPTIKDTPLIFRGRPETESARILFLLNDYLLPTEFISQGVERLKAERDAANTALAAAGVRLAEWRRIIEELAGGIGDRKEYYGTFVVVSGVHDVDAKSRAYAALRDAPPGAAEKGAEADDAVRNALEIHDQHITKVEAKGGASQSG